MRGGGEGRGKGKEQKIQSCFVPGYDISTYIYSYSTNRHIKQSVGWIAVSLSLFPCENNDYDTPTDLKRPNMTGNTFTQFFFRHPFCL